MKPNATEKIQQLLEEASHDESPLAVRMAELMVRQTEMVVQLAADSAARLQAESAASRDLVRDVMVGKLAIFDGRAARIYANLSTGRFGGRSAEMPGKTSQGTTTPAASSDDEGDQEDIVSEEEVLRDIDPAGQRGGHGYVPR